MDRPRRDVPRFGCTTVADPKNAEAVCSYVEFHPFGEPLDGLQEVDGGEISPAVAGDAAEQCGTSGIHDLHGSPSRAPHSVGRTGATFSSPRKQAVNSLIIILIWITRKRGSNGASPLTFSGSRLPPPAPRPEARGTTQKSPPAAASSPKIPAPSSVPRPGSADRARRS